MDLSYVGFINQHVIFSTDESNITSKNVFIDVLL